MRNKILACCFALAAALLLFWPADLSADVCWGCYPVRFPWPDGTTSDLTICLSLGDSNATGCYEINQGLGCVEWFPGSCDSWSPTDPPAV